MVSLESDAVRFARVSSLAGEKVFLVASAGDAMRPSSGGLLTVGVTAEVRESLPLVREDA